MGKIGLKNKNLLLPAVSVISFTFSIHWNFKKNLIMFENAKNK